MRKLVVPEWPKISLLRDGEEWLITVRWQDQTIESHGPTSSEENAREHFQELIDVHKKPKVEYDWIIVETR